MEIWKPISEYEGLYWVSNEGRVRSIRKILKPCNVAGGYLNVVLCVNNNKSRPRIHRLVAKAFIPNLNNKPDINHIDGNKLNNNVSNLEWCTKSENALHAYKTGLFNSQLQSLKENKFGLGNLGRKGLGYKIEMKDAQEIRSRYSQGETQKSIATDFNISQALVSHIINEKIWIST
jgi:hypothetical protein